MGDRCPGGWWGRHKLEPRYDDAPAQQLTTEQLDAINSATLFSDDVVDTVRLMTNGGKKYVHDICVRCGATFGPVGSSGHSGEAR